MPEFMGPFVLFIEILVTCFFVYSFLGIVVIPEDKVGLVTKKFSSRSLAGGKILALHKEAGYQADTLAPGIHLFKFWFQYRVKREPLTVIPAGKIGLLIARDGAEIPVGRILGRKVECDNYQNAMAFLENGGQKGRQSAYITAGSYRINTFLFQIQTEDITRIKDDMVGIITTQDGAPLTMGQIAGEIIDKHNNFQDTDQFLLGGGKRGLQQQAVLAGTYNINPWFAVVEEKPMTEIDIGYVGVVVSFAGDETPDLTGDSFMHGNIVQNGSKGVWITPFDPGKYAINPYIMRVEIVPTTNIVLNWADGRNEAHHLDDKLSTISVISKDGFKFSVDVSQIIHIPSKEAPKVIARFGSMQNLVSQVLEPMIANYFRNSAQTREVISFLAERQDIQEEAKKYIAAILREYNVIGVDTLIGDIVPPAELMKPLTDKKIAEKQKDAYETQMQAQVSRQELEKQTAIANMQAKVVEAERGVEIAERNANSNIKKAEGDAKAIELLAGANAKQTELMAGANARQVELMAAATAKQTELTGQAEAKKIMAIGESNAEAYRKAVSALGSSTFAFMKVMEGIADKGVKITPDILFANAGATSGDEGTGAVSTLIGLETLRTLRDDFSREETKKDPKA
jgi:uncharacterized membrane protein YqiK